MRSTWVLAALALAVPAGAGTITGTVELLEKGGKKAQDLSGVVVWVEGVKAKPKPAKATITMKGKQFGPHVVVVPVGGSVEFPNEDPIFHNVFSLSGENKFDLDLYKRPKSGSWTAQAPGVVRVFCNIHPQMSAIVVVRDSPYFTKAAADGSFTLEGVPPGKHRLVAWHERAGEVSTEVSVADAPAQASLRLDGSGFKKVEHTRKDGSKYSDEKY